jgi:hypothetical protein
MFYRIEFLARRLEWLQFFGERRNFQPYSHPLVRKSKKPTTLANVMDEGPLLPPIAISPTNVLCCQLYFPIR